MTSGALCTFEQNAFCQKKRFNRKFVSHSDMADFLLWYNPNLK